MMFKSILKQIYLSAKYYIKNNMYFVSMAIKTITPFALIYLATKGEYSMYILILIQALIEVVCYLVKSISNYIGKGESVPVPKEKFTETHEDGEVSVSRSRMQEMILYLADVEEYLERKGLL